MPGGNKYGGKDDWDDYDNSNVMGGLPEPKMASKGSILSRRSPGGREEASRQYNQDRAAKTTDIIVRKGGT